MDHLVHLFSCGHVLPVVDYVHKCTQSGTLDHSLVRHFVSDVRKLDASIYMGIHCTKRKVTHVYLSFIPYLGYSDQSDCCICGR